MQFSAIVLLVTICAVNASVININFYGDNQKVSNFVDDCNFQACDQLCRDLGFPGGACVGDRCDCDNFKPTPRDDLILSHSVEGCNFHACDQFCRRLGYPGGTCVDNRCDCDHIKELSSDYTSYSGKDHDVSHSMEDCNFQACDQLCRRLGFPGGACIGDRCDCDNFKHLSNRQLQKASSCDTIMCDDMCHRLRYAGGMCEDGNCQCY